MPERTKEAYQLHTRMMVGAFLVYEDRILLMHRGMHKALAPGMWSCVGGHMEAEELNHPEETCYREIREETGIVREDITHLTLRYMTVRRVGDELRTGFYFFGSVKECCALPPCDEGTLHWVDLRALDDPGALPMSFTIAQMVTHWRAHPEHDGVLLGGVDRGNERINWIAL